MRSSAAPISAAVAPDRGTPEAHVVGHGEVGVQAVGVPEQTHPAAHRGAIGDQIAAEHDRPRPARRAAGRRTGAAGRSCRPRWDRGAARSRPARRCSDGTGESREPAQHGHHVGEADDGFHEDRTLASPVVNDGFADTSVAPAGRRRRTPHFQRPKPPHDWRWVVGGIGKVLIVLGLMMFAFVGYQLWGTGIADRPRPARPGERVQEGPAEHHHRGDHRPRHDHH